MVTLMPRRPLRKFDHVVLQATEPRLNSVRAQIAERPDRAMASRRR
jgi:hypothetical protein